jgi:hypothetical protein
MHDRGASVSTTNKAGDIASDQSVFLRKLEDWIKGNVMRDASRDDGQTIARSILRKYERAMEANVDYYLSMAREADELGHTANSSHYKLMAEVYELLMPVQESAP